MVLSQLIPLVDRQLGTGIIIIFALVCVVLVAVVLGFIFGNKKKKK